MGDALATVDVTANVNGLNHLFNRTNLPKVKVVVDQLRASLFPRLLNATAPRQGSLWFAASVLTPNMDLTGHPARTHRRWLKWLMWLQGQSLDETAHTRVINMINYALANTATANASINWRWTESGSFAVVTSLDSSSSPPAPWIIEVTSISADPSAVDVVVNDDP